LHLSLRLSELIALPVDVHQTAQSPSCIALLQKHAMCIHARFRGRLLQTDADLTVPDRM